MSYLVLARKYRPATFSEVVGQEHVTRTLCNAFASGRVHHAFLFCGPRGCGKTTLARIVGKALNCEATGRHESENPSEPCGTCSACLSISGGNAIDYQEMDGASNRGIDAIRELTEAVRYQPAVLRKKVYVIDEVHMLTTEAFNALLKTLEEPPPHVTFVLATTEPHKLPNTILSRCQRYDFKLVTASRLAQHLMRIFDAEKLAIEPNAVSLLVRESGGSVRDALSLSDQLISYVGTAAITEQHVAEVLGVADRALTRTLVRALAGGEAGVALAAVEAAIERGVDEVQLARAIVRYLRDLSVLQVAPDRPELVDAADEERAELAAESRGLDRSRITQMFERMLRCCDELGKTLQPRLVLDCALIDVATVEPLVPLGDLIERLGELEARLIRGGARSEMRVPAPRAPSSQPSAPNMVMRASAAPQHHAGGGSSSSSKTVVAPDAHGPAGAVADAAARRPAPDFAKGTTPGQHAPMTAKPVASTAAAPAGASTSVASPAGASTSAASPAGSSAKSPAASSSAGAPAGSSAKSPAASSSAGAPAGSSAKSPAAASSMSAKSSVADAPPFDDVPHASGGSPAEAAGRRSPDFASGTAPGDRSSPPGSGSKPPSKPAPKRGKQDFADGSMQTNRDETQAAQAEARAARDAALAADRSRPTSSAPTPASMAPSGPVPAATTVATGSGPTEQLTGSPADVLKAWNIVLSELETRRRFSLLGPFQHARVMKWSADLIDLGFPVDVHSMGEMAAEKTNIDELRAIVRELGPELAHVKINVRMLDANESSQSGVRSALEDTRAKSAAERTKREAEAREHPITKHVLQTFGAQIKEIKTDV